MGLHRAGFEVVGWDVKKQKNYPFGFRLGDALESDLSGFDFVWASPPCQAYTMASMSQRNAGKQYPDLMAPTRDKIIKAGIPFIIENTPRAPMRVALGPAAMPGSSIPMTRRRVPSVADDGS